jgi:hypothetical protein
MDEERRTTPTSLARQAQGFPVVRPRSFRLSVFAAFLALIAGAYLGAPLFSPVGVSAALQPATGGYLFTTFRGESTPTSEQIYFGLSPDVMRWDALNNGKPVLISNVGEKGVRAEKGTSLII